MGTEKARRFTPDPARGLDYCRECEGFGHLDAAGLCNICRLPHEEQARTWATLRRPEQEPVKEKGRNG